jgi:hypothetical protein
MRREIGRLMVPAAAPLGASRVERRSAGGRPGAAENPAAGSEDGMDDEQQQRFREAVDRKSRAADQASRATQQEPISDPKVQGSQENLYAPGETQDTFSVRDKNSGKGHKTADKWNQ